jgi:hypothetical protein
MMSKRTIELTDDEKAALEVYRQRHGLRSHAAAIRHLIAASAVAVVRHRPTVDEIYHGISSGELMHDPDCPLRDVPILLASCSCGLTRPSMDPASYEA